MFHPCKPTIIYENQPIVQTTVQTNERTMETNELCKLQIVRTVQKRRHKLYELCKNAGDAWQETTRSAD